MKRDFRLKTLGFGLGCGSLFLVAISAFALTENPYTGIIGRNAFALKPPTAPTAATPPPAAPPGIELQGINTILGRPQVLLKIKSPPKPPEGAKEQSFVLGVADREGEVTVISIDPVSGVVQLQNQGSPLTLSMADNAAKPAAGPALPAATAPPGGMPPIPAPNLGMPPGGGTAVPRPAGGANLNTIGTGNSALPTRSLRTGTATPSGAAANPAGGLSPSGTAGQSYQPPNTGLSVEEQLAIMEVQRQANKDGNAGMLPPLPTKYQPR